MSTYTSELRLEKIGTGEQSGSWGTTTNTQYDILESAISGTINVAFASNGNDALTTANGSDDEARHMVINLTGGSTLDATRDMVVPTSAKLYIIRNGTTGGQSVRIIGASGNGITIPNGKTMFLRHDGTNVVDASDYFTAITTPSATITGGTIAGVADIVVSDTSPQLGGDLDCNASQIQWSKGADVASNGALAVGTDGNYFDVTGTTTITSINTTGGAGTLIKLHFDGACQLTHHASNLILAGAENFTTEAGDELEFVEYGSGTYRQTGWCLAGTKPGGGGGGSFLGEGASGESVGTSGDIIRVNEATLNTSQTMAATDNGSATGPLSIASGVTLTISSGATFAVI